MQTAMRGGVRQTPLPLEGRIVFAGTCLGRWKQATLALLLNSVLCWKFKDRVVFVLMTFGEDYDEITTLLRVIAPAVKYGLVQLCSGGRSGRTFASDHGGPHAPEWMGAAPIPGEAVPPGMGGMPELTHWHAPLAKNSALQAARYLHAPHAELMVSWDCDNLIPAGYVQDIAALYSARREVTGLCITCRGQAGPGLTGRLCAKTEDWFALNLYDEHQTPASSGQDVDMRDRLWGLAKEQGFNRGQFAPVITDTPQMGCTLPNDFSDTTSKHDRGWAKVMNCSHADIERYSAGTNLNAVWHRMSNVSWAEVYAPRLKARQWVRNMEVLENKAALGAWWSHLPVPEAALQEMLQTSSKRPRVTLSASSTEVGEAVPPTSAAAAEEPLQPVQGMQPDSAALQSLAMQPQQQPLRPSRTVNILMVGLKYMKDIVKTADTCSSVTEIRLIEIDMLAMGVAWRNLLWGGKFL